MKHTITFLIFLFVAIFAFSQNRNPNGMDRDDYSFIDAMDIYAKAAEEDLAKGIENPQLFLRLANSYYYHSDFDKAAKWYEAYYKSKSTTPSELVNYRYGQVLKAKGDYKKSDSLLTTYYDYKGIRYMGYPEAKRVAANKENRYEEVAPVPFNTDFAEYPSFIQGNELYIISANTGDKKRRSRIPTTDMFYLDITSNGDQMKPVPGEVNSEFNEGSLVITKDGKTMYFSRNNYLRDRVRKSAQNVVTINLYKAELVNGEWKRIKRLPFNNEDYSMGHPALSPDEKTLYFISDKPGGKGNTDLYSVPIFEDGTMGSPKNLARINTIGKEMFPFVDPDGVLYFASDRAESTGGLDIFMSPKEANGQYENVYNVGGQINSTFDDFAYVIAGNGKGYFGSNRQNNISADDIYGFTETDKYVFPAFVQLKGILTDHETNEPLDDVEIKLYGANDNLMATVTTDANGKYEFPVLDKSKMQYVKLTKAGYQTLEKTISPEMKRGTSSFLDMDLVPLGINYAELIAVNGTVKDQRTGIPVRGAKVTLLDIENNVLDEQTTNKNGMYTFDKEVTREIAFVRIEKDQYQIEEKDIDVSKIKNGKLDVSFNLTKGVIPIEMGGDLSEILSPIYFDYGKSTIRPDARFELNKIVQVLKKYPTLKIEIGSHTDSRGSTGLNQRLSQARALSTYNYLVQNGINRTRLSYKGYGESQLINNCGNGVRCPDELHQLNRRSSFVITNQ